MSTDLITVRAAPEEIAKIEGVARECQMQLRNTEAPFAASFTLAAGVKMMESLITDEMMQDVMALQGKPLGFKTDKDRDKMGNPGPGYPVAVVRTVFIEATVRGFRPVNNEFNIIAGRFYGCKTGFERMVKTFPGLADFQESFAVPERAGGKALVAYVGSWTLDGQPGRLDRKVKQLQGGGAFDDRFVIRVNEGMGDDAILGKAKRKAYAAIYDLLTGSVLSTPEGDAGEILDVESEPLDAPRVQQSSLFADAPPVDATSQHGQAGLIGEYQRNLDECEKKTHVGAVAKKAGGDIRLTDTSRREVMDCCTKRQSALSKTKDKPRKRAVDTQVNPAVDQTDGLDEPVASEEQIREDDWLEKVRQATSEAALDSLKVALPTDDVLRRQSSAAGRIAAAIEKRRGELTHRE